MNSKELMKKLEVGRVGYGTQTYNDVALTLNKEETLELLNHIEQLEKENKELEEHSTELFDGCALLTLKVEELKKENQELKEKVDYYKKEMESEQCFRESNQNHLIKYAQAIKILKEKLELKLEVYHNGGCTLNHKVIHNCITPDERCLRNLEIKEYDLLKEAFESVGGE